MSIFNIITGINESKILTKHVSYECKCKFDGKNVIQVNVGITINVDVSIKKFMRVQKRRNCEKNATCNCENEKYLASIVDRIISDEVIDVKEMSFDESNITCKTQSFYIFLTFLLIIITLIVVSIYCYLIKYRVKKNIYCHFFLGFLSRTFVSHRTAGEGGGHLFNSSLPLPAASDTDINRVITAESSPLHIASSQTLTGNLLFSSASR